MRIVKDIDLITKVADYDIILVGTNTYCSLTNGFQSKIRFRYPFVEEANNKTAYGDKRKLGTRLTLQQGDSPTISLLYICGHMNSSSPLDYDALEKCLLTANAEFAGKKVATTVLGASRFDGKGDKEKIMNIIEQSTPYLDLDVYDYEQMSREEEQLLMWKRIYALKRKDYDLYVKMWDARFELLKKSCLI